MSASFEAMRSSTVRPRSASWGFTMSKISSLTSDALYSYTAAMASTATARTCVHQASTTAAESTPRFSTSNTLKKYLHRAGAL